MTTWCLQCCVDRSQLNPFLSESGLGVSWSEQPSGLQKSPPATLGSKRGARTRPSGSQKPAVGAASRGCGAQSAPGSGGPDGASTPGRLVPHDHHPLHWCPVLPAPSSFRSFLTLAVALGSSRFLPPKLERGRSTRWRPAPWPSMQRSAAHGDPGLSSSLSCVPLPAWGSRPCQGTCPPGTLLLCGLLCLEPTG